VNEAALICREGDVNAASALFDAVRSAQDHLLRHGSDLASVNHALADLLAVLLPVYGRLVSMAIAHPTGAVATVLRHLRRAFGQAACGLPETAVSAVVLATVWTYHLD
jgi:predicted HAD superfamily Cof-like phosphohydrolase